MKRQVSVLINKNGDLALTYKEGGKFACLSLFRTIREERLSKGWTILNVVIDNKGWKKISSFTEQVY